MQFRQLGRRAKPLKARSTIDDLSDLLITSPADGDLLVYNSADQLWENTKTLTGDYTLVGSLTATTLSATGALSAATLTTSGAAVIGSNLTVSGTLAAGATTLASLTVSGNASVAGTLTVTGTLSFAGFSVSGDGTIAGNLTVGGTMAVTGAATLASTLAVTGALTASGGILTTNVVASGSITATGAVAASSIAGTTVSAAASLSAGTSVIVGGTSLDEDSLDFVGNLTLTHSGTTAIALSAASIQECTGDPNGQITATPGSLALRSDGASADRTLYTKVSGSGNTGWEPVNENLKGMFEYVFLQIQLIKKALASALTETGVGIYIEDGV